MYTTKESDKKSEIETKMNSIIMKQSLILIFKGLKDLDTMSKKYNTEDNQEITDRIYEDSKIFVDRLGKLINKIN